MEEWRTVADYPNYEVSNYGNVRSKDRVALRNGIETSLKGCMLKQYVKWGYTQVTLYDGAREKHKQITVHRLVAMAFIENSDNLPCVNHKDENKLNNHADNLEWCSYKYNSNYGTAIERRVKHQDWVSIAEKQSIPVAKCNKQGETIKIYKSMQECKKDGHNPASVSKCCNGYLKTYHGYIWKKIDKGQ